MNRQRTFQKLIPRYDENAVLRLIIYLGSAYVMARFIIVVIMVYSNQGKASESLVNTVIGLPPVYNFSSKWWTLITHGWVHNSFWQWLSNMIWLFMFGSSLQLLTGKKHLIPSYIMSYLTGGIFYLLAQWLPVSVFHTAPALLMGSQAGIFGLAMATLTLSPKFRYYLSDYFSFPLWVVFAIYVVLLAVGINFHPLLFVWLAGGALGGMCYTLLYKKGYAPGNITSNMAQRFNKSFPDEQKPLTHAEQEKQINDLLEKINNKGIDSLTKKERDLLKKGSKEL